MKRSLLVRMQHVFADSFDINSDQEVNDRIIFHIKDNTPEMPYSRKKQECEFCGRHHNMRDDICNIVATGFSDGNELS